MDVESAQRGDDQKVRQDKAQPPAQAPQKPPRMYAIKIPTWIASGPGHGLADRDRVAHFLFA